MYFKTKGLEISEGYDNVSGTFRGVRDDIYQGKIIWLHIQFELLSRIRLFPVALFPECQRIIKTFRATTTMCSSQVISHIFIEKLHGFTNHINP